MTKSDSGLANYLNDCRRSASVIDIPTAQRPVDINDGYRVQQLRHDSLGRDARAGFKIRCTTRVMQEFLNIDHPCAGVVRSENVYASGVQVDTTRHVRPAVECEIAVRLKQAPAGTDHDGLMSSIDTVMASIELVDDRYADYSTLGVPALIADDFFHFGLVLGQEVAFDKRMDLSVLRGHIDVNNQPHGEGIGSDIMEHPLNALAWLVRRYQATPYALQAGDVVSLGSVVETWWASAGEHIHVEFDLLGTVSCDFV